MVPTPASPGTAAGSVPEQEVAVRIVGLRKRYGDVVALGGVDLTIAAGRVLHAARPVRIGQDHAAAADRGLRAPDAGRIELGGTDVTRVPPYSRNVNTVFQDYALFPHMTVAQNIEYGLRVAACAQGGAARRWTARSRWSGCPGFGARKPAQLSGGQRQRVALARAIVNEPAGAAARRAARRARPQAPPADAARAAADPARGRHHLRLRHARPGRGADDERPHRGAQPGPHRADRRRPSRSTSARRRRSSPASSASPT